MALALANSGLSSFHKLDEAHPRDIEVVNESNIIRLIKKKALSCVKVLVILLNFLSRKDEQPIIFVL